MNRPAGSDPLPTRTNALEWSALDFRLGRTLLRQTLGISIYKRFMIDSFRKFLH